MLKSNLQHSCRKLRNLTPLLLKQAITRESRLLGVRWMERNANESPLVSGSHGRLAVSQARTRSTPASLGVQNSSFQEISRRIKTSVMNTHGGRWSCLVMLITSYSNRSLVIQILCCFSIINDDDRPGYRHLVIVF